MASRTFEKPLDSEISAIYPHLKSGASLASHNFTVASNSRNILIATGSGATRFWIGLVYGASNGVVTFSEIFKGGSVDNMVSNGVNECTLTFTSSQYFEARVINIYGEPLKLKA